jgi:hypothetical protein
MKKNICHWLKWRGCWELPQAQFANGRGSGNSALNVLTEGYLSTRIRCRRLSGETGNIKKNFTQALKIKGMENQEQAFNPDEIVELARQNPDAPATLADVANVLLFTVSQLHNLREMGRINNELLQAVTDAATTNNNRLQELAKKVIDENQRLAERVSMLEAQMMAVMADEKRAGLN